ISDFRVIFVLFTDEYQDRKIFVTFGVASSAFCYYRAANNCPTTGYRPPNLLMLAAPRTHQPAHPSRVHPDSRNPITIHSKGTLCHLRSPPANASLRKPLSTVPYIPEPA